MAYAFDFQEDLDLMVLVFRGDIPFEEETDAFRGTMGDSRMRPDLRMLVDRTGSRILTSPRELERFSRLMQSRSDRMGRPRVAVAVSSDSDFGMLRMLEGYTEGRIDHQFMVFRSLEEACDWLELDPEVVRWPNVDSANPCP